MPATAVAPHPGRPPLERDAENRMILGIWAGVGRHLGISPWYLRVAALLILPLGVAAYLFLAFAMGRDDGVLAPDAPARTARVAVLWGLAGFGLVAFGTMLTGSQGVFGILLMLAGLAIAWSVREAPGAPLVLVGLGAVVAVFGLLMVFPYLIGYYPLPSGLIIFAVVLVMALLALLALPLLRDLFGSLAGEKEARIREEVRADIAAHLHDSVLQSLTLIRANASDPAEVARLARAQERSLRAWLYEERAETGTSLAQEVRDAAASVEDRHGVAVEVVTVGDARPTARTGALVAAIGEAITNAVLHGAGPYSMYLEVSGGVAQAYVRDRGDGFDPDAVPEGRHGLRDSIIGRMERAGGSATVRSPLPSGGTEVHLRIGVEDE